MTDRLRPKGNVRRARTLSTLVALASSVALALPACSSGNRPNGAHTQVYAEGDDRLPNQSASDWVTYADAVLVVTPSTESEIGPDKTEIENGEGVIMRRLVLKVDDVLWTRPDSPQPAPNSFAWTAFGWTWHGDPSNRTEMASKNAPRVEMGHTYVVAVEWEPKNCPAGDAPVPASWRGLGDDGALPYDNGILGEGEIEGQAPARRYARPSDDPNYSLADAMTGESAAALQAALRTAQVTKNDKRTYLPSPTPCGS